MDEVTILLSGGSERIHLLMFPMNLTHPMEMLYLRPHLLLRLPIEVPTKDTSMKRSVD